MKLSISAFGYEQEIPLKYTCDGQNMNPALSISDVPSGTQSLKLIIRRPECP
jgi:phosphatidylethanolamine-binding protein (PEBP) family uncharacterized protein